MADITIEELQAQIDALKEKNEKLKKATDEACAEASKSKKDLAAARDELKAKMSDAEKAEAERAERDAARDEELKILRAEKVISGYEAQYLGLGFPAELAKASAKALADGDMETVFSNNKQFIEATKQAVEAAALNKQPDLTPGKAPSGKTAEELEKETMRKWLGL